MFELKILWRRCLYYALTAFKQLMFIFIPFQTFTSSTSFLTVQFSLSIHSFDFRSNFFFTKTNNRLTVFPAIKSRAKRGPSRISAEIKPYLDTPGGQEGPSALLRFLSNFLQNFPSLSPICCPIVDKRSVGILLQAKTVPNEQALRQQLDRPFAQSRLFFTVDYFCIQSYFGHSLNKPIV